MNKRDARNQVINFYLEAGADENECYPNLIDKHKKLLPHMVRSILASTIWTAIGDLGQMAAPPYFFNSIYS